MSLAALAVAFRVHRVSVFARTPLAGLHQLAAHTDAGPKSDASVGMRGGTTAPPVWKSAALDAPGTREDAPQRPCPPTGDSNPAITITCAGCTESGAPPFYGGGAIVGCGSTLPATAALYPFSIFSTAMSRALSGAYTICRIAAINAANAGSTIGI